MPPTPPTPPTPTRPDPRHDPTGQPGPVDPCRAIEWIGFHLGELLGTAGPAVLAVTVSWWFALVTALVGLGWAAHEIRLHRHRRALTAAHRQAITDATDRADHEPDLVNEARPTGETDRRAWR